MSTFQSIKARVSALLVGDFSDVGLLTLVDSTFVAYQLGLDELLTSPRIARTILSHQRKDGRLVSDDNQKHNAWHATAYAIAGLRLLEVVSGEQLLKKLAPLSFISQARFSRRNRFYIPISFLDSLHHWRSSHTIGGCLAIISAMGDLGLSEWLQIDEPEEVASEISQALTAGVNVNTGLWHGYSKLEPFFNSVYRIRHSPADAVIGAAAHYYWHYKKIGQPPPFLEKAAQFAINASRGRKIMEREPYCLDFDYMCIFSAYLKVASAEGNTLACLVANQVGQSSDAIHRYLSGPAAATLRTHALPGALAALAEADSALNSGHEIRDVFEHVHWL